MATAQRFGMIQEGEIDEETYETRVIKWRIPNISEIFHNANRSYFSPIFSFADNSWYFEIRPDRTYHTNPVPNLTLFMWRGRQSEYSVEFTYGVIKLNGCVEHLVRGCFYRTRTDPEVMIISSESSYLYVMNFSKFVLRRSALEPSEEVIFICKMKRLLPESRVLDEPKLKKLKKYDTLSENFKGLFADKESCDITLVLQNKEYKAHKIVLIARSSVFAAMFKHDTKEKRTGTINIPDCDPESFEKFLKYLYSGELEEPTTDSALHLYETSDKYDVLELREVCVQYLMENVTLENFYEIVMTANKYDDIQLFKAVQNFFTSNVCQIFGSSNWERLMSENASLADLLLIEMAKSKIAQ